MNTPLTEHSECIPRAGRLRQSVERQPSPFFALADLHAYRVATSKGQSKRWHQLQTFHFMLEGLRS